MTEQDARRLMQLKRGGYEVYINDPRYVDTPVYDIYLDEQGDVVYDSSVYTEAQLIHIVPARVRVSRPLSLDEWRQVADELQEA
jgi:hypothetical protein